MMHGCNKDIKDVIKRIESFHLKFS